MALNDLFTTSGTFGSSDDYTKYKQSVAEKLEFSNTAQTEYKTGNYDSYSIDFAASGLNGVDNNILGSVFFAFEYTVDSVQAELNKPRTPSNSNVTASKAYYVVRHMDWSYLGNKVKQAHLGKRIYHVTSGYIKCHDVKVIRNVTWYKISGAEYYLDEKYDEDPADSYTTYIDNGHHYLWVPVGTFGGITQKVIFSEEEPSVTRTSAPTNSKEAEKMPESYNDGGQYDSNPSGSDSVNTQPKLTTDAKDQYAEDWELSDYFEEYENYFKDLYWMSENANYYSAKSFNSIIGMPVQFMGNVDMRHGSSTFGHQYSEDILYDAPIAIIHPGAPSLSDTENYYEGEDTGLKGLIDKIAPIYAHAKALTSDNSEDRITSIKSIINRLLIGEGARFYGFRNEYSRYIQYVNTLCHLFSTFLGIGDQTIPGTDTKFKNYDDTIDKAEFIDGGLGLKLLYGNYPGMFIYYQPSSSLSQTFNNSTTRSSVADKLKELSNYSKEISFIAGGLGFADGKGVTVGTDVDEAGLFGLADTQFGFGSNNVFSRIFNSAAEGVGTIIGGNNLILPEIYSDSSMSGTEYVLNIKLVNPYGTPEAAFLFQMRHLARLLAISLPRQYGPNGYTAPFIIRAFSKGQFNVQLGIVTQLTINRAGSGGENQTVHGIPMELEVSMTIKDMYEQFAISNEYTNPYKAFSLDINHYLNIKNLKLIFNNIGLLDFVASFSGYNMNQPSIDMQFDYLVNGVYNNFKDIVDFSGTLDFREWKFARGRRGLLDVFRNAVSDGSSWLR